MSTLKSHVAVIVGASRGVGRAIATRLGGEGVRVAVLSRSTTQLQTVVDQIRSTGGEASHYYCDVQDAESVRQAIESVVNNFGTIDTLIYSTGVGLYGSITEYSIQDWHQTINTNLAGLFYSVKYALPHMQSGHIIALASGAARQGIAGRSAYVASKFGMLGFMESLAKELEGKNIKVCSILSGSVLTDFAGPVEEKVKSQAKGKKYLMPEDVASAIFFVLSQADTAWTQELNLWPA